MTILREGEQREKTAIEIVQLIRDYEDGTTTEDIIPILVKHEQAMKLIEAEPQLFREEGMTHAEREQVRAAREALEAITMQEDRPEEGYTTEMALDDAVRIAEEAIAKIDVYAEPAPVTDKDRGDALAFCKALKVIQTLSVCGQELPSETKYPFNTPENIENMAAFIARISKAAYEEGANAFKSMMRDASAPIVHPLIDGVWAVFCNKEGLKDGSKRK